MYPSENGRERFADTIAHGIGLVFVLIGGGALMAMVSTQNNFMIFAACSVYVASLTFSQIISTLYHLSPFHNWRLRLRRIDHAAIYLTIVGTFTPLFVRAGTDLSFYVLAAVWLLAIPAMLYKIFGNNVEPRWSLASYLGLGWIGIIAAPDLLEALPQFTIFAIFAGGFFYSFGTIFYARKKQAYRYSIWHSFVLLGGASFFVAIWIAVAGG